MPGFVLLVRDRADDDETPRVGFTVTKKIGNAVVRNRMKRRLRALAREVLTVEGVPGADHVLIGRAGGIERDYAAMKAELVKALSKIKRTVPLPGREGPGVGVAEGERTTPSSLRSAPTPDPSLPGRGE